ncbi:MAG: ABC transporter ATP-binding protein [Pseudomonadota bacterium]
MTNPYFNLIKAVWQNGRPWHKTIIWYYCAFAAAQAFMSLAPYAFGRTIDILQNFTPDKLSQVVLWLCVGVVVLLLFWMLHGPARVIERHVALKIQQAFRDRIYEQLTQLPLKWHQDHHSGNIISRVNRAAAALYRFAGDQFIYIETIVKFFTSIGFLLWISLPIGLLSLSTCMLAATAVMLFDRKLIPLYDAENEVENHVGAVFFDYISNMTTILTLRLGELTRNNMFQRMLTIWPFFRREAILNEVKWFSMGILLTSVQSIILIGYIVYNLKLTGGILIGTVVMIFRYQWELSDVFFNLSMHYSDLVRMNTDMKGLQPILNDVNRLAHAPQGAAVARQWHTLTIENLAFYHDKDVSHTKIFDDLSLTIKRGENIALIGASGGGKSTLLNLLRGLYMPDQVRLTIDDVSFNSLEPLQSITTLIPQDPEVFENTILFNITMDVTATPEAIDTAVKLAGFTNVLAILPQGLETDIRERGLNLSVGQKQRLALARGLFAARFSSLILIDEPTSSVDLPTEKEILAGILEAFPDAAIMVSLHRLHLLPKFDRIIMLSDGKIIANGTTHDLLNKPGPVRELWEAYSDK